MQRAIADRHQRTRTEHGQTQTATDGHGQTQKDTDFGLTDADKSVRAT